VKEARTASGSDPASSRPWLRRSIALGSGLAIATALALAFVPKLPGRASVVRFIRHLSSPDALYADRAKYAVAWNPATAPPGHRHLPRFPIPESVSRQLFPVDESSPWDALTYVKRLPNVDTSFKFAEHPGGSFRVRTNSLGMRENAEPMSARPDLRILVTGDSHTEGVCNNVESFPHVLRRELAKAHPEKSIEVLNAAKGSFSFYNYLGTLEKFLYLEPDVFVVAVYGPNDFLDVVAPYHYFEGTPRKLGYAAYADVVEKMLELNPEWLAQDGLSLKFFQHYPEEIRVAVQGAKAAVLDIEELCAAHGIQLVFVYIPGMFDIDREKAVRDPSLVALSRTLYQALEIGPGDIEVHDRMGAELMTFLTERGLPCVDVHRVFAGRTGRFYWLEDHHMDIDAHRAIGEALVPVVEGLRPKGLR